MLLVLTRATVRAGNLLSRILSSIAIEDAFQNILVYFISEYSCIFGDTLAHEGLDEIAQGCMLMPPNGLVCARDPARLCAHASV